MTEHWNDHEQILLAGMTRFFNDSERRGGDNEMLRQHFGVSPEQCILQTLGSCSRSKIFVLLSRILGECPLETRRELSLAIELLHQGTLIIDDIEDGAVLRKQKDTLWQTFGSTRAYRFGLRLMHLATSIIYSHFPTNSPAVFTEGAALRMLDGQDLDSSASWERSFEDYKVAAKGKTGTLYSLAGRLAHWATETSNLKICDATDELLLSVGVAHQICDDIQDASSLDANKLAFNHSDRILQNVRQSIFSVAARPDSENQLSEFLMKQAPFVQTLFLEAREEVEKAIINCRLLLENQVPPNCLSYWDKEFAPLVTRLSSMENGI